MRITIDVSPAVHRHAGLGTYSQELFQALLKLDGKNQYSALYHSSHQQVQLQPPLDRVPTFRVPFGAKPWRMSVLLAYYANMTMDRWLPPSDIFHATDHLLPPLRTSRTVFTIHDLIYRFFPEFHLPLNRWFLTLMLPKFMQRADAIIAVSENTRRDVMRLMQIAPEKIKVIPEGVNRAFHPIDDKDELERIRSKYRLPARFMLFFSTIEPRKNLTTLLEAYAALLKSNSELIPLVVAGRKGWLYQPILERIAKLGIKSHVQLTDWVDQPDAPALFNLAEVFVFPSLYEGFGLPPLEAMASGTPLICSNASSLPEVVGDAGILFDPRDLGALTHAMARVLGDEALRADLRQHGLQQARKFSWERTARETLAVYEDITRDHS